MHIHYFMGNKGEIKLIIITHLFFIERNIFFYTPTLKKNIYKIQK